MSVTVKGYAKINLHLEVLGIREDGYHSVETIMQSLSLCDDVSVSVTEDGLFTSECNVSGVPADDGNIAVRAAKLFFSRTGKRGGASIKIEKRIPMAAGLAGGSADAAATLIALNISFGNPLSKQELCTLGAELGADVPFCIVCGTLYSDGKGDRLKAFSALADDLIFVVACGGEGVSTPWAYGLLDRTFDGFDSYTPKNVRTIKNAIESGDKYAFCSHVYNIFEEPVLSQRPVAAQIRNILLQHGAECAMMSGSGPSVFAVYRNVTDAEAARAEIDKIGYFSCITASVGKRNTEYYE